MIIFNKNIAYCNENKGLPRTCCHTHHRISSNNSGYCLTFYRCTFSTTQYSKQNNQLNIPKLTGNALLAIRGKYFSCTKELKVLIKSALSALSDSASLIKQNSGVGLRTDSINKTNVCRKKNFSSYCSITVISAKNNIADVVTMGLKNYRYRGFNTVFS